MGGKHFKKLNDKLTTPYTKINKNEGTKMNIQMKKINETKRNKNETTTKETTNETKMTQR
jgi:hypothetical protein